MGKWLAIVSLILLVRPAFNRPIVKPQLHWTVCPHCKSDWYFIVEGREVILCVECGKERPLPFDRAKVERCDEKTAE